MAPKYLYIIFMLVIFCGGFWTTASWAQEPVNEPEEEYFDDDEEYIDEPPPEDLEEPVQPSPRNRGGFSGNGNYVAPQRNNTFSPNNGGYSGSGSRSSSMNDLSDDNPVIFRLTEPRKYWQPKKKKR